MLRIKDDGSCIVLLYQLKMHQCLEETASPDSWPSFNQCFSQVRVDEPSLHPNIPGLSRYKPRVSLKLAFIHSYNIFALLVFIALLLPLSLRYFRCVQHHGITVLRGSTVIMLSESVYLELLVLHIPSHANKVKKI